MGTTFTERYKNGETRTVYADIMSLGEKSFHKEHYKDIQNVLHETCMRASFNLSLIYNELSSIGYNFCKGTQYNFQRPIVKPLPDTEKLLQRLDRIVKPYGHVPESLKTFYKIIGGCNFAWDYDSNDEIPWEGADPIQIIPLDDLVSELVEMEEDPIEYLDLSADYFHKDNISGGPAYAIEITERPVIDGHFLHEEHDTTFMDYLRITFENCGFSRGEYINEPEFMRFVEKVRSRLLPI
jgi:hypothetical protein